MPRKNKLIIGGLAAAVLVVGMATYVALTHAGGDQITVGELKAPGDSAFGQVVQVKDKVQHGSIKWGRRIWS